MHPVVDFFLIRDFIQYCPNGALSFLLALKFLDLAIAGRLKAVLGAATNLFTSLTLTGLPAFSNS